MATVKGGEKAQKAIAKIVEKAGSKSLLSVGFMERAKYPDGTSVALVAAVQNYGAPSRGIPPRPFFSNMIKAKSPEWPKAIADLLIKNGYDMERTLKLTGEAIKGQLQQSIYDTDSPPLKPATVARKGFSKPLIDTGHMVDSVDYEVK